MLCRAELCAVVYAVPCRAGDINVINGIPWPEMPMEPKWYRFRFLNAAVSRPWLVKLKDDLGTDVGPQICKVRFLSCPFLFLFSQLWKSF